MGDWTPPGVYWTTSHNWVRYLHYYRFVLLVKYFVKFEKNKDVGLYYSTKKHLFFEAEAEQDEHSGQDHEPYLLQKNIIS